MMVSKSNTVLIRLIKGALANGFGQLVTVITQLVSVPLLLSSWGTNLYGEWLVLSAIPAYLSMSDFGFGNVAANEMTMHVARGNKKSALEVFQSVFALIGMISLIVVLLLLAGIESIPFESWFHFRELEHASIVQVILLLAFSVFVGLQDSLLEAGFRCDGNFAMGIFYLNLRRLAESLALFGSVYLGANPVIAVASIASVRICGFIGLRFLLKNRSPWILYGFGHARFSMLKRLASPAISFMAFPLGNALSLQGMIMAVSAVLGPTAVVTFSVLRTMSRIASQVMGLINTTVWPEISRASGSGNLELVKKLHRLSCQLSFWLSSTMIVVLFITGGWLIRIWTHGKVEIEYDLFSLMMALIFANSFWFTSSVVLIAVNRHQRMAILYLLGTSTSLLLAVFLLPKWGLNGAAVSLFSVDSFMIFYVMTASLSVTGDSLFPFLRQLIKPPIADWFFKLRGKW